MGDGDSDCCCCSELKPQPNDACMMLHAPASCFTADGLGRCRFSAPWRATQVTASDRSERKAHSRVGEGSLQPPPKDSDCAHAVAVTVLATNPGPGRASVL